MQKIQAKWFNGTACTDSGANVDSDRLSMHSFWGLYLITGTVSFIALIIFFSLLLYDYMRDPNVTASDNSQMDDPSTGKSLKTWSRAMKSFIVYVDQKEGSTSSTKADVSEISMSNSPCSTPSFTSTPSDLGTSPFSSSTLSTRSFSVLDCEYVADADENSAARTSSVSAPDQRREGIPPNTPQ
jgi:ionotropic glutamate receptor